MFRPMHQILDAFLQVLRQLKALVSLSVSRIYFPKVCVSLLKTLPYQF